MSQGQLACMIASLAMVAGSGLLGNLCTLDSGGDFDLQNKEERYNSARLDSAIDFYLIQRN